MSVDWAKIKTEYINENITQRELAEKYGVTLRQISNHATAEQWVQERERYRDNLSTEIQQRAAEKKADSESECLVIKSRLKLKFYQEIERRMETANEADGQELRRLVQNFKDMCDVSDADGRQQISGENGVKIIIDV